MVQAIAVTQAITNLQDAHEQLGLSPEPDPDFFLEWQTELPDLSPEQQQALDVIAIAISPIPQMEPLKTTYFSSSIGVPRPGTPSPTSSPYYQTPTTTSTKLPASSNTSHTQQDEFTLLIFQSKAIRDLLDHAFYRLDLVDLRH
ncbi:hypothetical protein [Leptolyngbya sp. PCC 6406]|uniref:hypothetical protein n=1 Tax=Leptolyngbya sp. PCC 6406 TaxID=1173264 RepID=UPI0002ABE676|nr:hypothetical protein [Leptolyngbya sp. PCC 6406]